MKKAVIVVGSHFVGKSRTINHFVKKKLGIGEHKHKFSVGSHQGAVLSQSREEAARREGTGFIKAQSFEEARSGGVVKTVRRYSHYDFLILAARPSHERPSYLNSLTRELKRCGYRVNEVHILKSGSDRQYKRYANEVLHCLTK